MVQFILWKQSVCEFFLSWRCHCNFAALEISKLNICQMETTVMWTENVSDEKGSKVVHVELNKRVPELCSSSTKLSSCPLCF